MTSRFSGYTKHVWVSPAGHEPGCGRWSSGITFVLQHDKTGAAVNFSVMTGWYEGAENIVDSGTELAPPLPSDLGFHSPVPIYEGQEALGECGLCDPCYYAGSSLNAYPVFGRMQKEGHDGVWDALVSYWHGVFDDVALPQKDAA